jgi:hypothetical protein
MRLNGRRASDIEMESPLRRLGLLATVAASHVERANRLLSVVRTGLSTSMVTNDQHGQIVDEPIPFPFAPGLFVCRRLG